jgi:hypothetical protein
MFKCCYSTSVIETDPNISSENVLSSEQNSKPVSEKLEVRSVIETESKNVDSDPIPVESVVPQSLVSQSKVIAPKNPAMSYLKLAAKKLFKLGAEPTQNKKKYMFHGTILHNDNVSPDLTPEEITKIQNNLRVLKKFYKDLYMMQANIITEVWGILSQKAMSETENKTEIWLRNTLGACGLICSIIGVLLTVTGVGAAAGAAFIIAAAAIAATGVFVATDMKASEIIGHDITTDIGYNQALNTKTFNAMIIMFDHYIDNTNECRDLKFNLEGQPEHTLRDLVKDDLQEGTLYDNLLITLGRQYRHQLVMPELTKDVNKQFLDLYFIQDVIHGSDIEHGHCYQPCASPNPPGVQRERDYNVDSVGTNARIWSNEEVVHFNHCNQVDVNGKDNNDLTKSYLCAIKEFTNKMPSTFIYPWAITSDKIYSHKFYIVMGYDKLRDDQNKPQYTLPENKFLNWLFIDDGAGNIINTEGVCFRYDALRAKTTLGMNNDVFLHAQQIIDQTNNINSSNIKCSSTDFRYGPKESSDLNKQYHVYVGDVSKMMSI